MKDDAKKRQDESLLQVYHAGQVSVVGFGGRRVDTRIDFTPYRGMLTELIRRSGCRVLAFDLAGVTVAPAGMLGVLALVRKQVDRIEIHNASDAARETLVTMQIGSLFELCDSVA